MREEREERKVGGTERLKERGGESENIGLISFFIARLMVMRKTVKTFFPFFVLRHH